MWGGGAAVGEDTLQVLSDAGGKLCYYTVIKSHGRTFFTFFTGRASAASDLPRWQKLCNISATVQIVMIDVIDVMKFSPLFDEK